MISAGLSTFIRLLRLRREERACDHVQCKESNDRDHQQHTILTPRRHPRIAFSLHLSCRIRNFSFEFFVTQILVAIPTAIRLIVISNTIRRHIAPSRTPALPPSITESEGIPRPSPSISLRDHSVILHFTCEARSRRPCFFYLCLRLHVCSSHSLFFITSENHVSDIFVSEVRL